MLFMAGPGVFVIRAVPAKRAQAPARSRPHRAGKISTYRVLELAQVPEILVSIPEYFRRRVQLRGGFPRMRQALRGLTSTRPMAFPFRPGSAGHSGRNFLLPAVGAFGRNESQR